MLHHPFIILLGNNYFPLCFFTTLQNRKQAQNKNRLGDN